MTHPTERFAAIGAATAPAFSCDGKTVFHLRGHGMPALWAMALDGSGERVIAAPNEKVAFLRRAPKDDRLVFGVDAGGDERQQLWLADADGVRAIMAAPHVIHDFGAWSPDGTQIAYTANDRDEAHFDVLVHTLGGDTRRLYHGTHQLSVAAWHPSGDRLLLLADEAEGDQVLLVLTLADATVQALPHPRPCAFKSVRWTKDGTELLGLSDGGGEFLALCRIDPAAGTVTPWIEASGADIEAWSLSPDGSQLATVENERGYALLRVATADATLRPVVEGLPRGVVADLAWSPDNATLVISASAPIQPPGLFAYDTASHAVRPVWLPDTPPGLRPFALVAWPSFDGAQVPGWIAYPASEPPPGGWPAVVWVHGGPAGQTRANFRPDMQMLLDQGYAVLMPNVRGSTGYGRSSTASDDVALRLDSVKDLAAAHRWLAAQPGINPARIGIMGQSYGGYMVLAAITEYPELWKTAVNYYGIADFTTLLAITGPWRRAHRSREYGDPSVDAELFDRISPIRQADRITAPLLVLHGTRDPRVPFGESEQIVANLAGRQHPVQFEVYDYAGHGFIRPDDRRRTYATVAEFFRRTL
jgi:dipeptidyl aminopeptidase/acylaminoacyl peptidase